MKMIAFVPARGGSGRLHRKNMRKVGGLPLFLRACYNLHQILPKTSIVVDSDDHDILGIAKDHGFETLLRPDDLATNATDGNGFFAWEVSNYPENDLYIQHLPPMAFCSKETLEQGLRLILDDGYDSIVCVGKEYFYLWSEEGKPSYDIALIPNSFNLDQTIFETMGLYMITAEAHADCQRRIGNNYTFIEIPKIEQIDIDYEADLRLANYIERGLEVTSPYKSRQLLHADIQKRLSNANVVICDVDGVLTDGKMIYSESGDELKNFNTRDGIASKLLKQMGMTLVMLSSGINEQLISNRGNHIGFDHIDVGTGPKVDRLLHLVEKYQLDLSRTIYLGDDVNDLEAMQLCDLKVVPLDAHPSVTAVSDIVLSKSGGEGCLRDLHDLIQVEVVE